MKIWKIDFSLENLNAMNANTLGEVFGIEFIEIGDDYLVAKMPVNHHTVQPARILHGGASVALAETVGSVASALCVDLGKYNAVGLEINANHLASVREGSEVWAKVTPIRIGKTIHVWNIEITDQQKKRLACVSRLTMAIVEKQ